MILVDNHFQFHLPDSNTIILWVEMDLASSAACSTTSSSNHACLKPPHRRAGCGPETESKQLWQGIPPHTCTWASHDGAAGMAVPNSPLAVTDVIPHPSGPLSLRTGLRQQSCFPPSLQAADWQMHSRGKLSLFVWLSFAPPEGFSSLRLLLTDFQFTQAFCSWGITPWVWFCFTQLGQDHGESFMCLQEKGAKASTSSWVSDHHKV